MVRLTITAVTATASLLFLAPITSAATLFSIETATDELVKIDSQIGVIEVVGTLDFDATSTDLASFGDRLFVLDTIFTEHVNILEIDPLTAATISAAQVSIEGNPILHAEGLTHIGEQLIIGFSSNGNVFSDSLGDLSLTGEVTNSSPFTDDVGITPTPDTDALGSDGTSMIFSADDTGGGRGPLSIFSADRQAVSFDLIETVDITGKDLVVDNENFLLLNNSFATGEARLTEISANGVVGSSISLGDGQYNGLALANESSSSTESVPEPTSTAGLLVAIALMAGIKYWPH